MVSFAQKKKDRLDQTFFCFQVWLGNNAEIEHRFLIAFTIL